MAETNVPPITSEDKTVSFKEVELTWKGRNIFSMTVRDGELLFDSYSAADFFLNMDIDPEAAHSFIDAIIKAKEKTKPVGK